MLRLRLILTPMSCSGVSRTWLSQAYGRSGDLGDVALEALSCQRVIYQPPSLSAATVLNTMHALCHAKGAGAKKQKEALLTKLLVLRLPLFAYQ